MAIKLRRGLNSDRITITPESGEPLWTTDTKNLYIGDGSTAGGNLVGGGGTVTSVATAGLISGGTITGTGTITTSMSTGKLVGRSTSGTGIMEEISIGTGLTLSSGILSNSATYTSPLTTKGDIFVRSTVDTRLPVGIDGQILTANSSVAQGLSWQDNYADWTSVVKHTVKNNGLSGTITKGTAVYVTGSDGTNMLVGRASNTSEATSSKTMGLMQSDITTTGGTQTGFVVTEGLLGGLNTAGTTAGDPVWLGVSGALIYGLINKPYAPAHLVFIGIVTKVSAGSGEIFVKVQNGFELKEIHDVDIITTTPINGHILGFDGTLWVNKTIAGWLGFTPGTVTSVTGTAPIVSSGGTAPAISIPAATTSVDGYLTAANWTTFNGKQNALSGTGLVKSTTGTITYITDNSTNWDTAYTDRNKWDGGATGLVVATGRASLGLGTFAVANYPTWSSGTPFVKMTAAGAFSLDTATYLTSAVTSVSGTGTVSGLSLSGTVTSTGSITLGGTLSTPVSTINDSTTVGQNFVKLTNPTAITFIRINADNTVSTLDASTFRTAIGAGTSSTTGTVTSVTGTAPVNVATGTSTPVISLASGYGDTQNPYASKTAHYILAAPNGTTGVPTFRAIVAADIPTLNQNTTGNAATVTTNANLTGPVTSVGNATAIANGAISNAMLANAAVASLSGTNTGDQTITLSGDVTGSGTGSFSATIASGVVKLDNMSKIVANSIIGNNTGALATPTALTGTNVTAMLDVFNSTNKGLVPAATLGALPYLFLASDGTWIKIDPSAISPIATDTIVANTTGLSASPTAIAISDLTPKLTTLVGDSGSGGTKGLVPAPASGDATAGKFLKADGLWAVPTTTIGTNVVTNAMLAQVATATFKGRTTPSTGNVEDLTVTQATAMLNLFSTAATTKGLVPGSNGVGSTYFLRADGTWAVPAGGGGGGGTTTNSLIIKADSGITEGTDLYTFDGSSAKTINIVAGTNITITKTAGTLTISSTGGSSSAVSSDHPVTLMTAFLNYT